MLNKIKNILKKILFLFYKDKKVFYGEYRNSLSFFHLFFWNLVRPGRTITRIRYNRFFFIPKKIKENDKNIFIDPKNLSKDEIINASTEKLKKYGVVIINEYFQESVLKKFEEEYKNVFNSINYNPSNEPNKTQTINFTNILSNLWFDEILIGVIQKYIKRLPLARNYPDIISVTPNVTSSEGGLSKSKTGYADQWHVDHATLIQPGIYFTDVQENGTHMEAILGTHTYPNVSNAGYLSDEYVKREKLAVAKLYGKRGSVQFHCGNIYHRVFCVEKSTRTWLKFHFSSGDNIYMDPQKIAQMLKNDFDLTTLDKKSRKIISGLFPSKLPKGYEIDGGVYKPNKFKGI